MRDLLEGRRLCGLRPKESHAGSSQEKPAIYLVDSLTRDVDRIFCELVKALVEEELQQSGSSRKVSAKNLKDKAAARQFISAKLPNDQVAIVAFNDQPRVVSGFTAVNRDESRHVGFGVKFLADAIKADQANALIVQETLQETLPVAPLVFVPPWVDDPYDFDTPYYHSTEIYAYAAKSLSKKLAAMGLDPAMLAEGATA